MQNKLTSICFFTITRLETGQIPRINKVFERSDTYKYFICIEKHMQEISILFICTLTDDKNKLTSMREIGQLYIKFMFDTYVTHIPTLTISLDEKAIYNTVIWLYQLS